jgi:hypothetical protein
MAVFNSAQNFTTLKLTRRIYNNVPPATGSSALAYLAFIHFYASSHSPPSPDLRSMDHHLRRGARLRRVPPQSKNVKKLSAASVAYADPSSVYDMTLFTYLIAFGHFASELLIFRSATPNPGVISPVIVSSGSSIACPGVLWSDRVSSATSLVWMFSQYDYYVRA